MCRLLALIAFGTLAGVVAWRLSKPPAADYAPRDHTMLLILP